MSIQQRITLPTRMVQLFEKIKYKNEIKNTLKKRLDKTLLIIACKRKNFNHYFGQTYINFGPEMLASGAWKHKKSKGDYFTILSHEKNPSLNADFSDFDSFGLDSKLILAIKNQNISSPTKIQSLAIPEFLKGKSVLCAAETGSGKTLAYMLPIMEKILNVKKQISQSIDVNQPIAVVILPSRELAQQVYDVANSIGQQMLINVDLKCGGKGTQKLLRDMPLNKMDILVATPGILSKLLSNKLYNLSQLKYIVFDEADTLFDDSFEDVIIQLIKKLKLSSELISMDGSNLQLALVGATMPKNLHTKINEIISVDSLEVIQTDALHFLLPHINQKFCRLGPSQRPEHLIKTLKSLQSDIPIIIFCNKPETVCFIGHLLTANSFNSITLHGNMPQKAREGRFENFQDGSCNILVCTDIASRGLDTNKVRYVINFEFPNFMSDYVHRVGRVGRVGSPASCHTLSYIVEPWDVELLWKIETSARKKIELHNVNANIKRKLNHLSRLKQLKNLNSTNNEND